MTSHEEIYNDQPMSYEDMISRQPDLTGIIKELKPFNGIDVLDLGAGSGRLSEFIAPEAKSLACTDISGSMLELLDEKLKGKGTAQNWTTLVADHRELPIADSSIDLVISGWSISYLANSSNKDGSKNLEEIMNEINRVLRPNGSIIILETLGTGTETPNPPAFLKEYYALLEHEYGFSHRWIRMDYTFADISEAKANTEFFFGNELVDKIEENQWSTVPECAGIWWKHL
ncbi:class I SAM-dependent methyltransferase [Paenibacillus lemnae]|uniref:Class I SAM-dependent methyltransferase n=1 Tax=Paenibacillus lemnae TaxID=1330551 RepID=A0A848MAZ5_PAELE|nr:class I SAM-dependent methyltransferase [Paenibacillus lemnae]NMO97143.1 class I SAM-dependent methyltransferase [Paenibacillus lemnae]